jgi:hypothetical protein
MVLLVGLLIFAAFWVYIGAVEGFNIIFLAVTVAQLLLAGNFFMAQSLSKRYLKLSLNFDSITLDLY